MRRRARAPKVSLARAGRRTLLLEADPPVDHFAFSARVLDADPAGRVEIEDAAGQRIEPLRPEHSIAGPGLTRISIVPELDTALTVIRDRSAPRPRDLLVFGAGVVMVAGALALTFGGLF